jgi:hypothetical protein
MRPPLCFFLTAIAGCLGIASAATVAFSIRLDHVVPTGSGVMPRQVFPGLIHYDAARVGMAGESTLTPSNDPSMTIRFDFGGVEFSEIDDTDPDFPQLYFTDGSFTGMNFWAENHHPASSVDGFVQIETTMVGTLMNYSFDGMGEYGGTVDWGLAAIPEPAGFLLWGAAGWW